MPSPAAPIDAVVFDLDGTLVDSREDLAAGVNAVRLELGLVPLEVPQVVEMVGKGARHLVRRALPDDVEGEAFDRAFERFLALYYDRCLDKTLPYPGVQEMLDRLDGRPLAVVTNKPERHTAKVLRGLDLERRLRFFLAGDSLPTKKPDPAPLVEAAQRLGVPVDRMLYVGDSETDGETARRAGCPLVLVRWGFGSDDELAPFDCALRPERPAEIAAWLA